MTQFAASFGFDANWQVGDVRGSSPFLIIGIFTLKDALEVDAFGLMEGFLWVVVAFGVEVRHEEA